MDTCLTDASLKFSGIIKHILHLWSTVLYLFAEFTVFKAVSELRLKFLCLFLAFFVDDGCFKRLIRNHLCQAVGLLYGEAAYACDILDG